MNAEDTLTQIMSLVCDEHPPQIPKGTITNERRLVYIKYYINQHDKFIDGRK